jgi:hypothetical protein
MMRRSVYIVIVIILTMCMTECDPGMFSLFPRFLTSVTQTADTGEYFKHVDGEKFYFYSMHADAATLQTDCLYIIQVPPSGDRNVAIYDGLCRELGTFSSRYAGAGHLPLSPDHHLVGRVIINLSDLVAGNAFIDETGSFPVDPDHHLAFDNNSGYELWTDNDIAPPNFFWRTSPYINPGFQVTPPPALAGPAGFDPVGQYALEAVNSNMVGSQVTMVFRRTETNELYPGMVQLSPPNPVYFSPGFSPFKMVPGTASFSTNGYFVVQRYDGMLVRMNENSNSDGEYPAQDLNEFMIAYGENDNIMYLFSPSGFGLFKAKAWWRDNNW